MKSFRVKRKSTSVEKNELDIEKKNETDMVGSELDDVSDVTVEEDGSLSSKDAVPYSPQRSKRIAKYTTCPCPDNDTWIEIIILLKRDPHTNMRPSRSIYYSISKQKAYWDEPLSGASRIIVANDVLNPFTKMTENAQLGEGGIWVRFMISSRNTDESRPLFWNCKRRIAHWDGAPKKKTRKILVTSPEEEGICFNPDLGNSIKC
eukprot:CAMPEP_0185730416 /NCGR_PEP_ID=MMETSP1171-20130828/9763_1 /TAXON_ID=374046 /ORGANISM="Helicotheca tamensis, Strain CCMP826" /LENGTH=204 /DNA_ID=CAMNT_0028399449 /DNA_START=12 /DNA_END=626 /DNA_ORIENTATION=+